MSELETMEEPMKVLAIKVYQRHTKALEELTSVGLYSSKSEILRNAAWELLNKILLLQQEGLSLKKVLVKEEIDQLFISPTKSICSKVPLKLLTMIDYIVQQSLYKNRSDFFRVALSGFLASDSEIFSHYINNQKN
jgi:Arc/MetJ-type ribon-helix-helix transcriptional regulator